MGSHISRIDGVYVCSFTTAETKNRREFQLAPSKVPETGLGERAAQKLDLLLERGRLLNLARRA